MLFSAQYHRKVSQKKNNNNNNKTRLGISTWAHLGPTRRRKNALSGIIIFPREPACPKQRTGISQTHRWVWPTTASFQAPIESGGRGSVRTLKVLLLPLTGYLQPNKEWVCHCLWDVWTVEVDLGWMGVCVGGEGWVCVCVWGGGVESLGPWIKRTGRSVLCYFQFKTQNSRDYSSQCVLNIKQHNNNNDKPKILFRVKFGLYSSAIYSQKWSTILLCVFDCGNSQTHPLHT